MEEITDVNQPDSLAVLRRLLQILCRSFTVYLAECKPASLQSGGKSQALQLIVADQLRLAERVAEVIVQRRQWIDSGEFPVAFTSKHDLGAEFLLEYAVECHRRDVAAIERCVSELEHAPFLRPLAEEILGNARGHHENLEEMRDEERAVLHEQPWAQ